VTGIGDLSGHLAARLAADPGGPAVTGDANLTWAQLADRVEETVAALKPLVNPGEIVALDIGSPVLGLVAALAADRLGTAYLPLDTAAPPMRRQHALESSAARAVLREAGPLRLEASALGPARPVWELADPGYVIYTSGTTGQPKGVHVPKRALIERLAGLQRYPGLPQAGAGSDGRGGSFLALSALSFDMSVVETLLPLAAGAPLVAVDAAARRDVGVFERAVREYQPAVVQATPSFWRLMIASGWRGERGLTVWCGGEALTPDLARALSERCGALWNFYGPTEATVWVSAWRVEPGRPISLGTALPGTVVELVDRDGAVLSEVAAEGEIRISGAGLASGYLAATPAEDARFGGTPAGRSYLTGDRARRLPDGGLEFLGREDNQVKIRGHRVELGEVEAALESHPAVAEAVALLVGREDPATARLAAVVVADGTISARDLRRWLADRLPPPMIPAKLETAGVLPRTSAGKLDRVAIAARMTARESGG
jgi:amino acid adenylation domain-containing protein